MKKLLFLFILTLPLTCLADKAKKDQPAKVSTLLKTARTAIKNGKDQQKAEENLVAAVRREDVTNPQRAEIYYTCSELEHSLNDAQNLKAYLKQSYDTAQFFSTILRMYQFAVKCDSVEQIPNEKGKVKFVYRGKNRVRLSDPRYHRNLYLGGNYNFAKGKYADAYQYYNLYRSLADSSLMQYRTKIQQDTMLMRSAYMTTISAYNAGKYKEALEYMDESIASQDSARQLALYEYKATCYQELKDSANWLQALMDGESCHPEHDWFYQHLIDYYVDTKRYEEAMTLTILINMTMGERPLYYLGMSKTLLSKGDYKGSISASEHAIEMDSLCSEAYYNKGIAYLNMAVEFAATANRDIHNDKSKKDRATLRSYYEQARIPMEEFRRQKPDLANRWAGPLYRIYLNLNMGKKFSEMDNILKNTK